MNLSLNPVYTTMTRFWTCSSKLLRRERFGGGDGMLVCKQKFSRCCHGLGCLWVPTTAGGEGQPRIIGLAGKYFLGLWSARTPDLQPSGFSVILASACQREFTFLPKCKCMDLCRMWSKSTKTYSAVISQFCEKNGKLTYWEFVWFIWGREQRQEPLF